MNITGQRLDRAGRRIILFSSPPVDVDIDVAVLVFSDDASGLYVSLPPNSLNALSISSSVERRFLLRGFFFNSVTVVSSHSVLLSFLVLFEGA